MLAAVLFVFALTAPVAAVDEEAGSIGKVVQMLKDMKGQLEKEAEGDDEVMDKMNCWCQTNDKEKTKAIADNTVKNEQLAAFIEEATASASTIKADLEQLAKDIDSNSAELAEATGIREKEASEFGDNEKQQIASVNGLTNAVKALGDKMPTDTSQQSFALNQNSFVQLSGILGGAKLRELGITSTQRRQVQSFLQTATSATAKAPASSEVFGVLKQMKESFESSLKDSQGDEAQAVKAFGDLKGAKDGEMSISTEQSDAKSAQLAETVQRLSEAKTDLSDTTKALEQDSKFLADLKERCSNMDAEFADRKKVRGEEITAVGEALGILNSDAAHAQLRKTVENFVQVEMHSSAVVRDSALKIVQTAAKKLSSPNLALIATQIRGSDVFATVIASVDTMITQLKKENKEEIEHKNWCVDEFNQNDRQTSDATDQQKALETDIEDLTLHHNALVKEVDTDNAQIHDMHLEMKAAGENREAQNKDFQTTVSDQRATQVILTKALDKLKGFYQKGALVQTHQAPPAGFAKRKGAGGSSGGVMMMIEGIIKESKTIEAEAVAGEQDAQSSYEEFIANSNAAIDGLQRGLAEKDSAKASATADKARKNADLSGNQAQRESLAAFAAELHSSCDFVVKYYEVRQNMRAKEIDSLWQAKAVMSGANIH